MVPTLHDAFGFEGRGFAVKAAASMTLENRRFEKQLSLFVVPLFHVFW
jgi:hypothetical protein